MVNCRRKKIVDEKYTQLITAFFSDRWVTLTANCIIWFTCWLSVSLFNVMNRPVLWMHINELIHPPNRICALKRPQPSITEGNFKTLGSLHLNGLLGKGSTALTNGVSVKLLHRSKINNLGFLKQHSNQSSIWCEVRMCIWVNWNDLVEKSLNLMAYSIFRKGDR